MLRRFGLLGLAFVFAATCGLIAPNSVPVVMADDAPSFALADTGDDSGGDDNTPKKRMKKREYAKVLQRKLKKGGPPPEKPKYKPWGKVITKDHQKHDGLITVYTKQEELYFVLGEDDFDKPMLSTMSLSQGIGSNFVFGGLPVDNMMFDFHREKDHVQIRRLSTNFRGGVDRQRDGGAANIVRILHDDGTHAVYAHLNWNSIRVRPGDHVERGEYIADSGNTGFSSGPHLHFEIRGSNGAPVNPWDYQRF